MRCSRRCVGGLTVVSEVSLNVPTELLDTVAQLVAQRAVALLAAHVHDSTPWMTTEEAVAYTRIPAGTFEKLSARGRIPFHTAESGRRKLYHRDELDAFLGYDRHMSVTRVMRLDAA